MGLLPDKYNCELRMRREWRVRFPRNWLQMRPLVSESGMHHDTCFTHVPWCMSGSLTHGGWENVPSIPGACATRNFTHLARGPCYKIQHSRLHISWDILSIGNKQEAQSMFALEPKWQVKIKKDHLSDISVNYRAILISINFIPNT